MFKTFNLVFCNHMIDAFWSQDYVDVFYTGLSKPLFSWFYSYLNNRHQLSEITPN